MFHVGAFPQLEDQLCSFVPRVAATGFDDRADSLVWALTNLLVSPMSNEGIFEWYRQEAAKLNARAVELSPEGSPAVSIDEERRRFAAMLAGRQPTANEISEHEARLLALHNAPARPMGQIISREA